MCPKTRCLSLFALYILMSIVSAIPVEPISGVGSSPAGEADPMPIQGIPIPLLPAASAAATLGTVFILLKLKPAFLTDSRTYRLDFKGEKLWLRDNKRDKWVETSFPTQERYLEYLRMMVGNSDSGRIPVREKVTEWVEETRTRLVTKYRKVKKTLYRRVVHWKRVWKMGRWKTLKVTEMEPYEAWVDEPYTVKETYIEKVDKTSYRWVLHPTDSVRKYLSMLDSAQKKLHDLEEKEKSYLIAYSRYMKRKGGGYWRTKSLGKVYDRILEEIEDVRKTLKTLNSWSDDLTKMDFNLDSGFKVGGRTFFFSNGAVRGISAEEAFLWFRREAEKAYSGFRASVKGVYGELTRNIKELSWSIVDSSLEALESAYLSFRDRLNQLKDEYETERAGRKGLWDKYFKKLYEDYYTYFRDESKKFYEDCVENINHRAYVVLVPESVKLEIKTKEREWLKNRKEMMRWRKRRWCSQLRDRARRYYKSLDKSFERLYDGALYENLKKQLVEWRDTALENAKKLRWQRTLEKAEDRFNEIDCFITDGFNGFREFTDRTTAEMLIQEFYKTEKRGGEVDKQLEGYNKNREDSLAYQSAVLQAETQSWIDAWNGKAEVSEVPVGVVTTSATSTVTTTSEMVPATFIISFDKIGGVNLQQILEDITKAASNIWDEVQKPVSWVFDFIKRPYYEGTFDLQNQPVVVRFGNRLRYTEEWCAGIGCFEGRDNGWIAGAGPQLKFKIKGVGGGLGGDLFIDRSGHNTTIGQTAGFEFSGRNSEFIADYSLPLIQRTFNNETNETTFFISNMAVDLMASAINSTSLERDECLVGNVAIRNCTIRPSVTCEYLKKGYWIEDRMNFTANVTVQGFDENDTYRILDYDEKAEINTPLGLKIAEFSIKLGGDIENLVKDIFR